LTGAEAVESTTLDKLPYPWKQHADYLWGIQAITPDGDIIIIAAQDVFFAVKRKTQELLWHRDRMQWGNTYHAAQHTLAMGKDGKSLFAVEANRIERWSVANGTKLSTLATNGSGIKILQTSRDGTVLLAGFGDDSFTVWRTDQEEPASHFVEAEGTRCAAISPDGQTIVLNAFGQKKLVVHDWTRGKRRELPLRTPYASSSAYGLWWSPDSKKLAAYIDTYPATLILYETASWKPIANWPCGAIGSSSEFAFTKDGVLFQLMDGQVNSLDARKVKSLAE
jgi:WD40 repeat protein